MCVIWNKPSFFIDQKEKFKNCNFLKLNAALGKIVLNAWSDILNRRPLRIVKTVGYSIHYYYKLNLRRRCLLCWNYQKEIRYIQQKPNHEKKAKSQTRTVLQKKKSAYQSSEICIRTCKYTLSLVNNLLIHKYIYVQQISFNFITYHLSSFKKEWPVGDENVFSCWQRHNGEESKSETYIIIRLLPKVYNFKPYYLKL